MVRLLNRFLKNLKNMFKKIVVLFLLAVNIAFSQNTIKANFKPETDTYSWVIIYQLKGAKQIYVTNAVIENNTFTLNMPKKACTELCTVWITEKM